MSVVIRPIVGHTTSSSARLWCFTDRAQAVAGVRIVPKAGGAEVRAPVRPTPGKLGVAWLADVTALAPESAYDFEFRDDAGTVIDRAHGSFTTMPAQVKSLAFLTASCHNVRQAGDAPFDAWKKLRARLGIGPAPAMLLMCGDQVYADTVQTRGWERRSDDELQEAFESCYVSSWKEPLIGDIWSSLPTYMIWDDHEIEDDWGSNKRRMARPENQRLYATAERAYAMFQHAHNPDTPSLRQKDFGFRVGAIGFYFLDLRTHRGRERGCPVLGAAQLDRLQSWLLGDGAQVEVLFVVSPVPLAHAANFIIEGARRLGLSLETDAADQWTFGANQHDLDSLLNKLFWWQSLGRMRQAVLLGGDVHMPTYSVINSDVREHARRSTIPQLTSSAISNVVVSPMLQEALARILGEVGVRRDIDLIDGKYWSVNRFIGVQRNFGEVQVSSDLQGGWQLRFLLHQETGPQQVLDDLHVKPLI